MDLPAHYYTMGMDLDLNVAMRHATRETVDFLREEFGLSAADAYSLASIAVDFRVAEAVDSVQMIYNIFDQNPEDELFPACAEMNVAVIARVPFDEGTLTGTLTKESKWPEGDWRNIYFAPENLIPSVERAERLKKLLPADMSLPGLALRFILSNPHVSTIIPGMRKISNVEANIAASDAGPLPDELLLALREHRWERKPTKWSQ